MLDLLGLSVEHETVYRAMLQRPDLNVLGLAAHLALSCDQVREALDALADLALIRLDPDAEHARLVRPQAALTALLARVEADVTLRQRRVEATRTAIAAIAAAHQSHGQVAEGRILEGAETVRDRLAELAGSAAIECLSFTTGRAQSSDTMAAEAQLNQPALRRGVEIRNVYQESFRHDPATLAHARRMADLGGQSRTTPTLPMPLIIVDCETALVPIDPGDASRGALEVSSPGVITGLVALFELVWQMATPFGERTMPDQHGLTPQERELIRLLSLGHTDEMAARRLAMSLRSVQRMMTSIAERLNTASRFQAGVHAARRGWV